MAREIPQTEHDPEIMKNTDKSGDPADPKGHGTTWSRDPGAFDTSKEEIKKKAESLPEDKRSAYSFETEASIEGVENPVFPDHFEEPTTSRAVTPCGEVYAGMEVIGSDGRWIGTIKTISADEVLIIDRYVVEELRVPLTACTAIQDNKLQINVRSDVIDNRGWAP